MQTSSHASRPETNFTKLVATPELEELRKGRVANEAMLAAQQQHISLLQQQLAVTRLASSADSSLETSDGGSGGTDGSWAGLTRNFVTRLTAGTTLRLGIAFACFGVVLCGAVIYRPFSRNLVVSLNPPPNSPSGIAKAVKAQYFEPDPILLVALLAAPDGAPLLNVSAPFSLAPNRTIGPRNWTTPLTPCAATVSHELRAIAHKYDNLCEYAFLSYFDMLASSTEHPKLQEALQLATRAQLFDSNGSHALVVVSLTTCHGQRLTSECVGKQQHCDPVVRLTDEFATYAEAHPGRRPSAAAAEDLRVEVISTPMAYAAVLEGVEVRYNHTATCQ
eukprot:SAG11_NODE_1008_length_6205_cov_3.939240_3_plen_334_part_00